MAGFLSSRARAAVKVGRCLIEGIDAEAFAASHREISESFVGAVGLAVMMSENSATSVKRLPLRRSISSAIFKCSDRRASLSRL